MSNSDGESLRCNDGKQHGRNQPWQSDLRVSTIMGTSRDKTSNDCSRRNTRNRSEIRHCFSHFTAMEFRQVEVEKVSVRELSSFLARRPPTARTILTAIEAHFSDSIVFSPLPPTRCSLRSCGARSVGFCGAVFSSSHSLTYED